MLTSQRRKRFLSDRPMSDTQFAEAAELAEAKGPGDAGAHAALGALWWDKLGRVDRAVYHYRRAWEIGQDPAAMDALRAIHAALGDEDLVERLYEEELEALGDGAPARSAALAHALGALHARRGAAAPAARHLERALALAPDDEKKERLAEVYAGMAGDTRALPLCLELAAASRARGDGDSAVTYLRRALGVDPSSRAVVAALEETLGALGRWADLDALWQQLAAQPPWHDPEDASALLEKQARVLADKLGDREAAKRCWQKLGAAGREPLRELYAKDGDWDKLAALLDDGAPGPGDLMALAGIAREHLGDRDRAAAVLRRVLALDPLHADAQTRLAEHLREKRDWRGLAELQAATVDLSRDRPPAERVRRLEELAETCEARLGDVERALAAWNAALVLDGAEPRARAAIKRLEGRAKMWASFIGVLEKEAASAPGPRERAAVLLRMAGVYREKQVDPRRAIALCEEVLALAPGDAGALKALADLYEREGNEAGLAQTLRRQLVALPVKPADLSAPQRIERLALLRRLAQIYDARLGDVEGVVYACTAILELHAGDRDAMDRLERVLERSGDLARLEETLVYRAEAATGPAERAKALRRLARLADGREDTLLAMERWERALRVLPNDHEALEALARLYESVGRWGDLANMLERLIVTRAQRPDPPLLRRHARVVDGKLGDGTRAVKAWRQLLDVLPRDREALEALARRLEEQRSWRELATVLGRQIELYAVDDRARAAEIALARAAILEERLGNPAEAAAALEQLIAEVAPQNGPAHERLIALALARGDVERAVRLLERTVWLAHDPGAAIARLVQIGELTAGPLGDPRRALQAQERVLELDAKHQQALAAAATLHARLGQWTQHVATLERLATERQGSERQDTYVAIARAVEEHLGDAPDGLRWLRRAHELAPGPATLDELRHAAERHGAWSELAEILDDERRRDTGRFVALSRELAQLHERRRGDPLATLTTLGEAAAAAPDDDTLIDEAEEVAGRAGTPEAWRAALAIGEAALPRRAGAARVRLHEWRARLLEDKLGEDSGALDERLLAFALAPDEEARAAIVRLAARTGRWEDVVTIDGKLFRRAATPAAKVQALARAALVIEEQLGDRPRAFKGWLQAFRLAPEDGTVEEQLWRLAAVIGTYAPKPSVEATIPLELEDADLEALEEEEEPVAASPPPIPTATKYASAWEELAATVSSLPAPDVGSRRRRLFRAAEVWERGAHDVARAFTSLGKALALSPGERETKDRLYALATAHDGWDRLAELLATAAERAHSGEEAAGFLHEVATIHADRGRAHDAEVCYRRILGIKPDDAIARERLVTLHRGAARWAEVAASLEERADPRLGSTTPAAERPALLAELAQIYNERLGKPYEAIATLERLVELTPDDIEAYATIAALYERLGRWAKAATALGRVAELADAARARETRRRIGKIYEEELEHFERAAEAYAALTDAWPDDADALEAQDRLLELLGRASELAEVLKRRAALAADSGARVALLRRRAELLLGPVGRPEEGLACLRQARTLAPDDDALAEELLTALGRGGAREAAGIHEERAVALERHGAPAADVAARWLRVARVRAEELGDPAGAEQALERARKAVPDHPAVQAALGKLRRGTPAQGIDTAAVRAITAPPGPRATLRARVTAERRPADVLALGRLLAAGNPDPTDEDAARALLELAAALGAALSADDKRYLRAHPTRTLAPDDRYDAVLDDLALCADPADGPLPDVLAALGAAVLPSRAAVADATPVPDGAPAAARIYAELARVLGAPAATLHAARSSDAPDVEVRAASVPAIVIGPRLLAVEEPDPLVDAELRFRLARAAFTTLPGRLPAALPDPALGRLVELARARPRLAARLRPDLDLAAYRAACARAADRAGLVVCGSVTIALRLAGHGEHVLQLAADERYLAARARLGVGAIR
jgi:tetratricopeptide (TPR) repeat protein